MLPYCIAVKFPNDAKHTDARVILVNTRNEVLLLYHNKLQRWIFPGGKIELNETPEAAAKREAYEELGIHISSMTRFIGSVEFAKPHNSKGKIAVFEVRSWTNDIQNLEPAKHAQIKWSNFIDADDIDPTARPILYAIHFGCKKPFDVFVKMEEL